MGKTTVGQIEAYVRQQASADHVPGTAVGIVEGSQPVLLSGFGDASASTSFFLGSLSNKAGLTELSFAPSTTFTQAINGFEAFPLTSPPGKKFQYSDANYTIAGYIVQQVSGQSYDSYVQQHIFAPLGMTHTYAMTGVVREPGLTRGYANWLGLKVPLTDQVSAPLVPAGYIISSASDMTHYLTAEMNGGAYNGTRVLPAQAMQETHAPLAPVDGQPPVPGATSYRLGWGVGTVNGAPVIVHDGQLRDFDTAAAILPEGKTAVVLLMNQDPELVVNDDSLYNGVMQGITTGRFPAISHSFVTFYAVLDALVLATLVLMIASFWRTGRWLRKFRVRASRTGTMRAAVRAVGLDLVIAAALAAAVVFGLGAVTGYVPLTPTLLIFAAPDLAIWLYAIIAFFVARAIVRAICIGAGRGTPQPASP